MWCAGSLRRERKTCALQPAAPSDSRMALNRVWSTTYHTRSLYARPAKSLWMRQGLSKRACPPAPHPHPAEHVASFYLDAYSRPENKRGGAWMGVCIGASKALERSPVAYLTCNGSPPVGDTPSLMTFREVR